MFSILIPLYNKADYIVKAVESVCQQTFQDFELIIVNDGSTDHGPELIDQLCDQRIKIIHQANAGVSAARNIGVKHAQFDYLAFLDADDWWDSCFLEELYRLICQFPGAGIYGSNYFIVKNGANRPAQIGVPTAFNSGYINYFNVYATTFWVPINCSFVVLRKSVFEQTGGFKATLKFGEDLDLWIRIALNHQVGYINKCLAYSNQDVDTQGRALGAGKHWSKQEHVIFNLAYLADEEKSRPSLHALLDGLRVRSLVEYYFNGWYPQEVEAILDEIDFTRQPFLYQFIYQWPKPVVELYFWLKHTGSLIKQNLTRAYSGLRLTYQPKVEA